MKQSVSAAVSDLAVIANNLETKRSGRQISDAEMARLVRQSRLTLMRALSDMGESEGER